MAQRPTVTQMSRKFESHAFTTSVIYSSPYKQKGNCLASVNKKWGVCAEEGSESYILNL